GYAAQRVPFLGLFQTLTGQGRARHAGIQHRVPMVFQPLLQQADVRGAADAIGPFQHDELAPQFFEIYCGGTFAKEGKSSHRRLLVFFVPANACDTILRTSACCSSIDRVASITTRPNSSTIFSYSSMMRP